MKSYSEISNKYMKQNKKRSILTILGITLATTLLFAIGTFLLSFRDSMIESIRDDQDFEFQLMDLNVDKVQKIKGNAEVKNSSILAIDENSYVLEGTEYKAEIEYGDNNYYEKIDTNEIKEGKYPASENEVVINSVYASSLNLNVGDKIVLISEGNDTKVTKVISGITKLSYYSNEGTVYMSGYLDDYKDDYNYDIFVNLKSDKNKQEIIKKVMESNNIPLESKSDNSSLLYLLNNGGNDYMQKGIMNIAIFVIVIIIVCTVTVIYNSFNISVIERIRYFGILKSIGATNKQIKKIIYKEGFLMGVIAFPISVLIGYFALKFGTKLFLGNELLSFKFNVKFYPIIILFAAILEFITIFISLIPPVRKVKKISAVEAIKNQNEIKTNKIKKRKNRIINKIFGVEGGLAYKNIRRTPTRFVVTVVALTISITLFNVFYSFMDFVEQTVNQQFLNVKMDSYVNKLDGSGFNDDEIKEIEDTSYYKKLFKLYDKDFSTKLPADRINDSGSNDEVSLSIIATDSNEFINYANESLLEGKIEMSKLKDNGVILVDSKSELDENKDVKLKRITNYKVGDKVAINKKSNEIEEVDTSSKANNDIYEATVVAIISEDILMGDTIYNGIGLIFDMDTYKKLAGDTKYNTLLFKFQNDNERERTAKYISNNEDYSYVDFGEQVKEIEKMYSQVEFFVYCFIIAITIISIVNIYNTISTNLILRRREFATLKAIGMTEKQLSKSVILEGTLYGIMSAIVGGILSIVLGRLLINMGGALAYVKYSFPIFEFAMSILAAILVTYVSTLIPLNRLKKSTIVEGINQEE